MIVGKAPDAGRGQGGASREDSATGLEGHGPASTLTWDFSPAGCERIL